MSEDLAKQSLLHAYREAVRLNQASLQALDLGQWERLEALFQEKAALNVAWDSVPREGWSREELDAVFAVQSEAARSEARLTQAMANLGPKLRTLGEAYGKMGPKPGQKGLDIGS